jgi:hypothetical protein
MTDAHDRDAIAGDQPRLPWLPPPVAPPPPPPLPGAPHPLPPLPVWAARSFWASLLLALSVLANAAGIDLYGWTAAVGLGADPDSAAARLAELAQLIAPLVFGLWAWAERRSPRYRLVLGRAAGPA